MISLIALWLLAADPKDHLCKDLMASMAEPPSGKIEIHLEPAWRPYPDGSVFSCDWETPIGAGAGDLPYSKQTRIEFSASGGRSDVKTVELSLDVGDASYRDEGLERMFRAMDVTLRAFAIHPKESLVSRIKDAKDFKIDVNGSSISLSRLFPPNGHESFLLRIKRRAPDSHQ